MITRRDVLGLAGGALGALTGGTAAASPGRIVLWTSEFEPIRLTTMRYVASAWRAWSGGAAVEIRSVGEQTIYDAVRRAPAGERPDIVNTGGEVLLSLGLLDIVDGAANSAVIANIGENRFLPGVLSTLRLDTQMAAVPFHGWCQVLWYRRDWFEEAGLAPPDTVEALERAVARLHRPDQGRIGIVLGTDEGPYTQQFFAQLARSHGAELFAADGTPRLTTDEVRAALECYARLARYGSPTRHHWRARDFYIQGRAAVMVYSTFIMDDLAIPPAAADSLVGGRFRGLDGGPFDPRLAPATGHVTCLQGRRPGVYSIVNGFAVTSVDPARRAEAIRFLTFLFRPDVYVAWLQMQPGGMLPVIRGVAESDAFLRDPGGVLRRFGRLQVKALAEGLAMPGTFLHWDGHVVPQAAAVYSDGTLSRMVARVLDGTADPAASAALAQAEAERLVGISRVRPA